MAQSTEYPDLRWMPPRAFGTGRDGKAVRYIVIHYTAGAERNTSAEDGAAFDQRRTDGTSTHYFVDSDSVVQCVLTRNRGNAARHRGNRLGIQYELCGTVQTRAQWLDAASLPTLRNAARQAARDCKKYGIPARRLTVAETRQAWTDFPDGPKGIVGHVDCTNAYPEDGGDHTDPGAAFPWSEFLDMVREEIEELDMPSADEIADAVALKIHNDLRNPDSGLYKSVTERVQAGVLAFVFDAYHAVNNTATYTGATGDVQKRMRNARDTLLGVLGGPVDLTGLDADIAEVHAEAAEIKSMLSALSAPPAQG